jgi:hypothetical protein
MIMFILIEKICTFKLLSVIKHKNNYPTKSHTFVNGNLTKEKKNDYDETFDKIDASDE